MSAFRKSSAQIPDEFVHALLRLPLRARVLIATRFNIALSEEQLQPSPEDTPDPSLDALSPEELEAEALRGLMGYGRFGKAPPEH